MVERHSQYLQNRHALKVYTLLNESQIEHGFGCSYQSQTNEHSQHNEFLFAKRRIEMERILKTCKTPFYFKGKKKMQYTRSQIKGTLWILLLLSLENFILVNRNLW